MYNDHFGLKHAPFKITPDTRLFYSGGHRGEVLDALIYAVGAGEGIVKVVGEVGSGKTMLCRMLEERLPDNVDIVYLANPSLSPEDTLHAIALEMALDVDPDANRLQVMHALHHRLLEKHAEHRQVVIFVEEAQSMPMATLEEIRLLSNLETKRDKLLQIVLFGQPELDEKLSQPEIRQLNERITHSFYLQPFTTDQIREYVNHRLRAAGYRGPDMFRGGAYRRIAQASGGLTRRINILADKALLAAYAEDTHDVGLRHVDIAIRDSRFPRKRRRWGFGEAAVLTGFLVLLGTLGWVLLDDDAPSLPGLTSLAEGEEEAGSPLLAALSEVVGGSSGAPAEDAPAEPAPEAPPIDGDDAAPSDSVEAAVEMTAQSEAATSEPENEKNTAAGGAAEPDAGAGRREDAPAADEARVALSTPVAVGEGGAGRLLLSDTLTHAPRPSPEDDARLDAEPEPAADAQPAPVADARPGAEAGSASAAPAAATAPEEPTPSAPPAGDLRDPSEPDGAAEAVVSSPGGGAATASDAALGPLTEARLAATRTWLQHADRGHFSIQLLLTDFGRRDNLEAFLRARRRAGELEDYYVYETRIRSRVWFGVLYREYDSFRKAKAALETLPAELSRHQPFIRNVRDIAALG